MNISIEEIFEKKQMLQEQIHAYEEHLQEVVKKQTETRKIEVLAQLVLEYDQVEKEIEDRAKVFALLSAPPQSLRNPFVKANLFELFVAAETVSVALVDFLVTDVLIQLRGDIQNGEDNTSDLIQGEYKDYIIPGKLIAQRFEEIDGLLDEMNRFCKAIDSNYDEKEAQNVLEYAFRLSIDADTQLEPSVHALEKLQFRYLTPEARQLLINHLNEHLAIVRFENARKQSLAMEHAIQILHEQELKEGK